MAFELDLLDLPPLVDPATLPESPSSSLSSPTDDETLPTLLDDYPSAICSYAELSQFVTEDQTTTTRSHARSRPADYIPRPPNAFILFRSAFVKANAPQAVFKPKKGSSLSKIIGTVWKQLDKVEHDQWEQEAVRALARHREKYPDWRFRLSNMGLTKESCGRKRKGDEGDPDGRSGGAKRRRASEKNYGEQVIGFTNDAPITLAPVAQLKTSLSHARDPKAVDQPRKHASTAKPKLDVPTRIAAKLPSRHPHSLPFAATHRHPEPFPSPQAPLPVSSPVELVLDPNAIPYVPTPEAFDSLFDGIDTFSFPYSAASPVDPASPVSFGSPATPPFIPSSSPAPLTPTTEWFSRRGSMDSTASESQGGPYTPPAFDAPCFDLDVAVYNPTSLPAPIDPFIEGTPTYFNFDYDSSFVCESPVYGLTGDAPALAQSKYSSLTGWDMLSADSAI